MPKYTKYLEFSQKERAAIRERDNYRCIFCQVGYKMPPAAVYEMDLQDIMHYIPRSSRGLGIRQNGAVGGPVSSPYVRQWQQWRQKRNAADVPGISGYVLSGFPGL